MENVGLLTARLRCKFRMMRMKKRIASAVLVFAAFSFTYDQNSLAQSTQETSYDTILSQSKFDGVVAAKIDAAISPYLAGIVTTIKFEPGQKVKTGELLFELYSKPYEAKKQLAHAKLHQAEAELKIINDTLNRYEKLIKKGDVSEKTYTIAQIHKESATAKIAEAQANLRIAEINLEQTRIVSPIDGKISHSFVKLGAYVETVKDMTMAIVTQLNPISIEFQIPYQVYKFQHSQIRESKALLSSIKLGLVLPDGNIYPHTGEVDFTDELFDKKTQLMTARGTFPNPETLLRPGLRVKVFIQPWGCAALC